MKEFLQNFLGGIGPGAIPLEIILLLLILGLLIFFWDFFERKYSQLSENSELESHTTIVALKNDATFPSQTFSSSKLGLRGRPDAIVKEKSFLIPVDLVPLSSKIQDRHVIKIIAYLRLIEEKTGKSSPYGILLMGKKRRMVRVKNSDEKQRWLETLVDEMNAVADGVPALASPHPAKCKNCDVRDLCNSRV